MFELGNKRYFGLDIGESAIKLVEIYKTRDGYRLKKARLVELSTDPLFDDSEKRAAIVKESLDSLLAEEKIDSGTVALSISGQSVFVRPLKIPKIAKNKIEQIIQYEAQLQVPFPINEVIWNYELFEIPESPEIEATLVAVKKDIVEEKLRFLVDTGLSADFVETDSFTLFNVLDFVKGIKNKIILDIGGKITNIIIVEERKIWTRSILVGGNDLTKAIAAEMKISFKEAEALKRKEGIIALTEAEKNTTTHAAAISDAISPVLVELLTDVSKSLGYYKSQFGETKMFDEILLTGGGSKLRNMAQFVRENIDMPTRVFNVLEDIKSDLDFDITDELAGRTDVAVGLALRTVIPLFTKSNLLPRDVLLAKEFERKKWYIFGSLLVGIFIFLTLIGFVNYSIGRKEDILSKTSALVERYTDFHKEIVSLQGEIDKFRVRLGVMADVSYGRKRALETVTDLARLLPADLWLTGIHQDGDSLTLEGKTKGTFENINEFKNALIQSGRFKAVSVESANVLKDKGVKEDIRAFTIDIKLYPAGKIPEKKTDDDQA